MFVLRPKPIVSSPVKLGNVSPFLGGLRRRNIPRRRPIRFAQGKLRASLGTSFVK
jgi:hypothetical protein